MNAWDRLLAVFAPRMAAQNVAMRSALGLTRSIERPRRRFQEPAHFGAQWGRNTGRVEDAVPRALLSRWRVRRLVATNPYAAKVKQTLLNNLIGFGIVGTPVKGTPKKVVDAWARWQRHCDWMGRLDFFGLQDLAAGSEIVDGECFIVRRFDRSIADVVPTRIEIFDADMLHPGGPGGQSIEYDTAGRPTTYHFRARRAGPGMHLGEPVSFAARDVIHLYRQDWPGQTRGHSLFGPAVKRFEDMDEYLEAEVVRKKIEACFAAFITPSAEYAAESADLGGESDETTHNDFEVEVFEPGMIERLRPGDDIKFGDPKPSAAIGEFARVTLLGATTGAGVPYEHGTGDLSNVNYSSYRAGSLEFQRGCGRTQWLRYIPVMLERIWDWFLEDGYQTGVFGKRWYDIAWTPPAFESIDREKDIKADVLEIAAGLESHREQIAKRGGSFEDKMAEIAEDRKLIKSLKLEFESGAAAKAPPAKQQGADSDGNDDS